MCYLRMHKHVTWRRPHSVEGVVTYSAMFACDCLIAMVAMSRFAVTARNHSHVLAVMKFNNKQT